MIVFDVPICELWGEGNLLIAAESLESAVILADKWIEETNKPNWDIVPENIKQLDCLSFSGTEPTVICSHYTYQG